MLITCRFAAIMYTEEGKKVAEQIWKETLEELEFAGVKQILDQIGGLH